MSNDVPNSPTWVRLGIVLLPDFRFGRVDVVLGADLEDALLGTPILNHRDQAAHSR
jgi:hypothetical protein